MNFTNSRLPYPGNVYMLYVYAYRNFDYSQLRFGGSTALTAPLGGADQCYSNVSAIENDEKPLEVSSFFMNFTIS